MTSNNWGGAREGAGRKPNGMNQNTLEKRMVEKMLHQKIMQKANRLLRAMMQSAEGESYLFKEVEEKNVDKKGNERTLKKKVLVSDPKEIEEFLNECAEDGEVEGLEGKVDGVYYYIKTKPSDWKAIESLFDRVFGKSKQSIEMEGVTVVNEFEQLSDEQLERQIKELTTRITILAGTTNTEEEDTTTGESGESTSSE